MLLKQAGVVFSSEPSDTDARYELWYNRTALQGYQNLRLDPLGGYYKVGP
jgi:hypothetical protein